MLNDQGQTTLSSSYQTAVPSNVRKKLKLKPGAKMTWYVENDQIRIKISPDDFIKKYYGIGKELYDGTDAQEYVNQLREDRSIP